MFQEHEHTALSPETTRLLLYVPDLHQQKKHKMIIHLLITSSEFLQIYNLMYSTFMTKHIPYLSEMISSGHKKKSLIFCKLSMPGGHQKA